MLDKDNIYVLNINLVICNLNMYWYHKWIIIYINIYLYVLIIIFIDYLNNVRFMLIAYKILSVDND